jgi:hypothetical protein
MKTPKHSQPSSQIYSTKNDTLDEIFGTWIKFKEKNAHNKNKCRTMGKARVDSRRTFTNFLYLTLIKRQLTMLEHTPSKKLLTDTSTPASTSLTRSSLVSSSDTENRIIKKTFRISK